MLPRVAEIFGEPIPSYFTLLVIGFALATYVGTRWATRSGLDREAVIDLGLFSLIAGVAGARILHVLADGFFWDYVHLCTDPSQVVWRITRQECTDVGGVWVAARGICQPREADCFAWARFWNGGLTYYGGLIGAAGFAWWFLKRERFPFLKAADMAGMTIAIGLFFGRLGCFLGGCCFGLTTDHAIGVAFPEWSPASRQQHRDGLLEHPWLESLPVHPTQLYEAIGCLAISAVLIAFVHPRKRFDGQVFLLFLLLYSGLRFVLEYWRADDRGALLGLSTSQLISLAAAVVVAILWEVLSRRARRMVNAPAAGYRPVTEKP